jgi:DnaJ-class molecular chaperone
VSAHNPLRSTERCPGCDGYGATSDPANRYGPEIDCPTCDGTGWVTVEDYRG